MGIVCIQYDWVTSVIFPQMASIFYGFCCYFFNAFSFSLFLLWPFARLRSITGRIAICLYQSEKFNDISVVVCSFSYFVLLFFKKKIYWKNYDSNKNKYVSHIQIHRTLFQFVCCYLMRIFIRIQNETLTKWRLYVSEFTRNDFNFMSDEALLMSMICSTRLNIACWQAVGIFISRPSV